MESETDQTAEAKKPSLGGHSAQRWFIRGVRRDVSPQDPTR